MLGATDTAGIDEMTRYEQQYTHSRELRKIAVFETFKSKSIAMLCVMELIWTNPSGIIFILLGDPSINTYPRTLAHPTAGVEREAKRRLNASAASNVC